MPWLIDENGFATTSETPEEEEENLNVPVTEMPHLMVLLMWTCLTTTAAMGKNAVFDIVFTDTSILAGVISLCDLQFAPGLFEVLQSSTAPSLVWLKGLPTDYFKRWAIYLLVLEKPFCTPRVYVGSGTNSEKGVKARMRNYDNKVLLPRFVEESLKEGYEITTKGLLLWCPIPSAADIPILRALFLLLEAVFTFVFWAVKTKKDGDFYSFGIASLYQWAFDKLGYTGLCSHSPLGEGLHGARIDLSAEELETLSKIKKEKAVQYRSAWYQKANEENYKKMRAYRRASHYKAYLANPSYYHAATSKSRLKNVATDKFHCEICQFSGGRQEDLDKHLATKTHLELTAGIVKAPSARDIKYAENKVLKKYYCKVCDHASGNPSRLNDHFLSKTHLQKAASVAAPKQQTLGAFFGATSSPTNPLHCAPCNYTAVRKDALTVHKKSATHKRNAAAAADAKAQAKAQGNSSGSSS